MRFPGRGGENPDSDCAINPAPSRPTFSLRLFLKSTAAAAAPMIVPARIPFGGRTRGAQMKFGCIGVGRQGRGDMQELIYAAWRRAPGSSPSAT